MAGGQQFAALLRGSLWFRVDDALRAALIAEGSAPFTYSKKTGTVTVQKFYAAPEGILDDPDMLRDWATRAIDANR